MCGLDADMLRGLSGMSVTGINGSGCCCCGVCVVVDVVVVGVVSETRRFSQFTVASIDWTDGGWTKGAAHRESGINGVLVLRGCPALSTCKFHTSLLRAGENCPHVVFTRRDNYQQKILHQG